MPEKQPNAPHPPIGELKMIWRFVSRYPLQLAIECAALVCASCLTLYIPATFKRVVDYGFSRSGTPGAVGPYFSQLLWIIGILAVATLIRLYTIAWLGERTVADIRTTVQRTLVKLSPAWFDANRPAEVAARLTADTAIIEQMVGSTVSVAAKNVMIFFGGSIYLFFISPKLSAILVGGVPLIISPLMLLRKRLQRYSRASQDRLADIGALAVESFGAMRVVQGFGQEDRESARFQAAVDRGFEAAKRRFLIRAVMTSVVIGLLFSGVTFVMWSAVYDIAAGRLTGGTIAAFVLTAGLVTGALNALTELSGDLFRAAGAAGRLSELLQLRPEISAPRRPTPLPIVPRGSLVLDDVTFAYPGRDGQLALDGVSLAIAPGETVAVVGPSGAGKSTLFQLIQRFYDPLAGRIYIDGVSLAAADPSEARGRTAVVPQDIALFSASVRDNLRYGRWEATDREIWQAADAANASGFIRSLPLGLDTPLGEHGLRLSGGQRQRIAIARALVKNAPILLLDEATSALDAESEALIQRALSQLMAGRTTLVIAHRLATVRAADRIVVMDRGRVVEVGSHTTLTQAGGLYARLASLQFADVA